MAGRISNSFSLMKASANVLRLDKELLVFPLLSGLATVLVTATFIAPFLATGVWAVSSGADMSGIERLAESGMGDTLGMILLFGFYVTQYTVIFFFNAALVGAALIRLDGGDPTVSDGLAIASKRIGAIIGYAVIAATVGMVLRFLSERAGIIGKLIIGLIGMAWTLMTYMTVPVLVTKDIGPVDAIKESGAIFRRTWGEQVVGNFGISWAMFFLFMGWTALSGLALYLMASLGAAPVIGGVLIMVSGYVFLALFGSAVTGIYTAALYRYAMTGEVQNFDAEIMGNAFRAK